MYSYEYLLNIRDGLSGPAGILEIICGPHLCQCSWVPFICYYIIFITHFLYLHAGFFFFGRLGDFFRYTWGISMMKIPGENLFLVRYYSST